MPKADDLWLSGLKTLHVSGIPSSSDSVVLIVLSQHLKGVTMRAVKGPLPPYPEPPGYTAPPAPPLRKLWSAQRRKITPKVGQLTDDPREIARIVRSFSPVRTPHADHFAFS
jgi:nucleoporin GLE1